MQLHAPPGWTEPSDDAPDPTETVIAILADVCGGAFAARHAAPEKPR